VKKIFISYICFPLISIIMYATPISAICPCEQWYYDWAEVNIRELVPSEGKIVFSIQCFWTCVDGWDHGAPDIPPIFKVYRPDECMYEPTIYSYTTPGWEEFDKYRFCGTFCGRMGQTCECVCPPGCGCHNNSYHDYTPEFNHMWGTFRIDAHFKGQIIFSQEFEFPPSGYEQSKLESIEDIRIHDYTGEPVANDATFDVDESLIIEAVAEWDQDPPANHIFAVIKTNGTNDSLIVSMGHISGGYQNAFYRGIAGSGTLRQLYPDPYWFFKYHVIAIYPEITGSIGCDCVFNVSGNVETAYGDWLKYYYNEEYSHDEPPPVPPDYFDHPVNTNPIGIFYDEEFRWKPVNHDLVHPPLPYVENLHLPETPALTQISSSAIRDKSSNYDVFIYCCIQPSSFTDSILGNIWDNPLSQLPPLGRKEDKKYPGFYLIPPPMGSKSGLTDVEKDTISNLVKELLREHLYSPQLMEFVYKYTEVCGDCIRDEFFGRAITMENEISVGGWFGKFVSLGIFADYSDVGSFLDIAITSFKLPPVDKNNVAVYEKGNEFVYSLRDKENMYILRGYNILVVCEFTTGDSAPNIETIKVIELIKYYDEEFIP